MKRSALLLLIVSVSIANLGVIGHITAESPKWLKKTRASMADGDYHRTLKTLKKILSKDRDYRIFAAGLETSPDDLEMLREIVKALIVLGQSDEASMQCENAEIIASGADAWNCLGELYERTGTAIETTGSVIARGEPKVEFRLPDDTPMTPPVIVRKREPEFPKLALVAHIQGSVILKAIIRKDGTVGEIEILRSNRPNMGFEEAAVDSLRQWLYLPAFLGKEPVAIHFTVLTEFGTGGNKPAVIEEPDDYLR